jgi:cation:H+ antiporter
VAVAGRRLIGDVAVDKVNQWTLLVGTIPLVFALSSGSMHGLPLDDQQRYELLLTAAQSLFAVSTLITLGLSVRAAGVLFVLFAVQFLASVLLSAEIDQVVVLALSGLYLLLALGQFVRRRRELVRTARDGLWTPFAQLTGEERVAASP